MAKIIPIEDLRLSPTAALFQGGDDAPVSTFVTQCRRGQGPGLHLHPYPEVFVVLDGHAVFSVGDDRLEVGGGHVVVVPEQTPHRFQNAGDDLLRVVSIHPSPTVRQTDL